MNCPSCDGKNREDARFCKFCGTDLLARCRMCGSILDDDARFCDACGTSVAERDGSPAPATTAARKVVTVLFADLSGSTALEERMDAESVRSILDRFYAAMRAETERFGGNVVKFTGDGVMAAFGVPEVHEDDAVRAVDAALAMRDELHQLADDLSLDVRLNIGINTGEVVVSASDDDVVGDAVNVAARLEGAATGGEILVGEETWRLTRATSRYEPVEPLMLKGKSEPVPAYRLLSADERTADSAAAPFVGREGELGRLLAVFQDAVDARAARLVTIIGSPGLGKTRLSRELMAEVADVARVRETRCDPAGESTFAPIADLMRAAIGISELDSEDEVLAKLMDRLPEDDEDRERIALRAAAIFGVGQPGSTEETFWALRRLIENRAREMPVVLVLDDIHWAEPLLLDLIEHLAEWIRDAPVLLLGTARPELRDLRPSLAEGGRAAAVIALEGLDRAATAQLALNLLEADSLPDELLARIPASTEGNPLFVRELVRMLVDDRVLLRTPDGWAVTRDVDAIEVPPTISSLLAARIDRLRSDERTVVELASVVGKEFYRGALVDLAPSGVRDLVDGCLESLRRKELVEPVGTYWIDEPVYRFHHVLIRDAAYRRLLKESRADVHARVADWLERKTADVIGEHDEVIGYHLEQAHEYKRQLGRPDDTLGGRAAALLGAAAERALDRDDLPAAATLSGRALDRLPMEADERAALLLVRCEALLSMGEVAQGALALDELERLASDPRMRAWATCFSGHLANLTAPERSEETERRVAAAATELLSLGDQAGAAKAYTVLAQTLAKRGRFAECESVLDDALTAARAANDRRRITATLGFLPHAVLWGPLTVSRAGGRCLDIVRLLRITTGSPAVEATSLRCQAVLEAFRGRTDAARRMLRSARRTLTELGLQNELLDTEQFAGIAELVGGDAAEAMGHLRASYAGYRSAGVDVLAAQSAALLARAHLRLGEDAQADEFVSVSEQLASGDLKATVDASGVRSELLARRGEFAEARRLAERAVELASATDALFDHGNALRSLAAVLRAAGDAAGAQGADDRALALFERKGATALLQRPAALDDVVQRAAQVPSTRAGSAQRFSELFAARDWAAMEAILTPAFSFDDRRPGLRDTSDTRSRFIDMLKIVAESHTARFDLTTIATRGERLELNRSVARGRGGGAASLETEFLSLWEVGEDGLAKATVSFAVDDFDEALAELDERYAAQGTPGTASVPMNRCAELCVESYRALSRGDADVALARHGPRTVSHDRRSGSRISLDPAELAESVRQLALTRPQVDVQVLATRGDRLAVLLLTWSALGPGGYELQNIELDEIDDDDLFVAPVLFDVDDLDAALAELEERYVAGEDAVGAHRTALDNLATRASEAFRGCYVRRDWEALRGLLAESYSVTDIRSGMHITVEGFDAQIEEMQSAVAIGATNFDNRLLATRGDRLCLHHSTFSSDAADSYVVEFLSLVEVAEDGRILSAVRANVEQLDAAFAELEDRYLAGDGAPFVDQVRPLQELLARVHAHDWDAARASFTSDFVFVDHTPAGRGRLDMEGYLASVRAIVELTSDWHSHTRAIHRCSERGVVTTLWLHGSSPDSADVDLAYVSVMGLRDGLVDRIEFFPESRLDDALARLDDLGDAPRSLENTATRAQAAIHDAILDHAWDRFVALHTPDCVTYDLRAGVRVEFRGIEARLADAQSAAAFGITRITGDVLAIRGDRLGLRRVLFGAETYEVEFLVVAEVDEHGKVVGSFRTECDNIDLAFEELDRRYLAGEGRAYESTLRASQRPFAAFNRQDWAAAHASFEDSVVIFDRRAVSLGEFHGPDLAVDAVRGRAELIPDQTRRYVAYHALDTDRYVVESITTGTSLDGVYTESGYHTVGLVRNGRIARWDIYPLDALGEALARFEELGPRSDDAAGERLAAGEDPAEMQPTEPPVLDNLAVRQNQRTGELMVARDWDATVETIAGDVILEDRRHGVGSVGRGRAAWLANFKALADLGLDFESNREVLAVRGDHLCLIQGWTRDADGNEVVVLQLDELDESGRVCRFVWFDLDDRDAAFAELDRMYADSSADPERSDVQDELIPQTAAVRNVQQLHEAGAANDWTAYADLYSEDAVLEDRRAGLRSRVEGRSKHVEFGKASWPGTTLDWDLVAMRGDRLVLTRELATARSGFEVTLLSLTEVDADGRRAYVVLFDRDDLVEALAELDKRFLEGEGAPYADVIRLGDDQREALRKGNFAAYGALMDPNVVLVDHRPASLGEVHGVDEVLDVLRALSDVMRGMRPIVRAYHALATNMTLLEAVASGRADHGGVVEMAHHRLQQWRDGRVVRMELFPMDELAEAKATFDRLSSSRSVDGGHWAPENAASRMQAEIGAREDALGRFDELEAPPDNSCVRNLVRFAEAWEAGDFDRMRTLFHEDFVDRDARSFQERLVGVEDVIASARVSHGLGLTHFELEPLATRGDRFAAVRIRVTDDAGNETPLLGAFELHADGRAIRGWNFEPEDEEGMFAELDRLYRASEEASSVPGRVLDNACLRALETMRRAFEAREWDRLGELLAPHGRDISERAGMRWTYEGRDERLANFKNMSDVGMSTISIEPIAIRGERLALSLYTLRGRGFERQTLEVDEIDEDGRHVGSLGLDPDDLDAGFEELDRRYLQSDEAGGAAALLIGLFAKNNSGSLDRDNEFLSEHVVFVDRQPAGRGTLHGSDALASSVQRLMDLVPDFRFALRGVLRAEGPFALAWVYQYGTNASGGLVEFEYIGLTEIREGKAVRIENFAVEALDAAHARVDELLTETVS